VSPTKQAKGHRREWQGTKTHNGVPQLNKAGLVHHQDLEVVTRFLPAMMSIVVDDYTFTVEQKLPSEEKTSLTYPTTLPETFSRYLRLLMPLLNPAYSASA